MVLVIEAFIYLFLLWLFVCIVGIMAIALLYFKNYTKFKIQSMKKNVYTDLTEQIRTINALIELIDNHINIEIAHKLRAEYTLGERYNPLNIDKDCAEISSRVYNSINKDVFINIDRVMPIYNDDFWMHYITKKTTCSMLSATQALEP